MKYILASLALMATTSAYAQAEDPKAPEPVKNPEPVKTPGPVNIPTPNKDIWTVVPTATGAAFYHNNSGGVCDATMRDLALVGIKDYTPDGNNSSCQYEKKTEAGLSRLTIYIYTHPELTGPVAFGGAKQAILDINKHAAVTVSEDKVESNKCFNAMVPQVAEVMLKKEGKTKPDSDDEKLQMGVVMFNIDIAERANAPARSERTLLSVYQNDEWIVKMRVTVPAGETSSIDACRYAGLPSIALAGVMD